MGKSDMNQNSKLIAYIKTHYSVTTLEAFDELRICRLSERIRELERSGWVFEHRAERTAGRARVVRYRLVGRPWD